MAQLNEIVFIRNTSGLGAPLQSKDHVSGLIVYGVDPSVSGHGSVQKFFSLQDAEDLGLTREDINTAVVWYHVREFFEKNSRGELFLLMVEDGSDANAPDMSEIQTVQNFANGEIRQFGLLFNNPINEGTNASTFIGVAQSVVNQLQEVHTPANVILGFKSYDTTLPLSALPDLTTLDAPNVSLTIGQDAGNIGKSIVDLLPNPSADVIASITDLGAKLGAISFANVNESIAWIEEFPMVTDGREFDEIAFVDGSLYRDTSSNEIRSIDSRGYLFLLKQIGIQGTYNNDSYTAVSPSNDLSTIENGRTIDKAVRVVRARLLPKLAAPILVNADGTLTQDTIAVFGNLARRGLDQMQSDNEISASAVIINPSQDILTEGRFEISLEIVPVGVARSIIVNIGFVPQIN